MENFLTAIHLWFLMHFQFLQFCFSTPPQYHILAGRDQALSLSAQIDSLFTNALIYNSMSC